MGLHYHVTRRLLITCDCAKCAADLFPYEDEYDDYWGDGLSEALGHGWEEVDEGHRDENGVTVITGTKYYAPCHAPEGGSSDENQ